MSNIMLYVDTERIRDVNSVPCEILKYRLRLYEAPPYATKEQPEKSGG